MVGVDVNARAVETINRGEIHITEPDLDIVVRAVVTEGYLRASTAPEPADAFLIAVPTPFKAGETGAHDPDLSFIEAASRSIAPVLKPGNLVVLESTSPVGTTERMAAWLAGMRPDLTFPQTHGEASDIRVAHCPERVLPGHVLRELVQNDRLIGGMTPRCSARAVELYKLVVQGDCIVTNPRTAEMAKLTENSFRDVNIAFANELSVICAELGIDVWELIALANRHPRVNILRPGPGVGGHCIAVDPWFIVARTPGQARLIRTAREINDAKPAWVLDRIEREIAGFLDRTPGRGGPDGVTVACWGLAFKPDIDDLRESPALNIVRDLGDRHAGPLLVVEPHVARLPPSLARARARRCRHGAGARRRARAPGGPRGVPWIGRAARRGSDRRLRRVAKGVSGMETDPPAKAVDAAQSGAPETAESGAAETADIHDRITEAYLGEMGEAFMHRTRRRIHWIRDQVRGRRVLDIGCSQGIVCILLARAGHDVTGIDLDARAIAEARAYLAAEPREVQDRVRLVHGDAADLPAGEHFDTVVLGEILEHFEDPGWLIDLAADRTAPGGRLVVTVPFGVNDFPDHKQTFYLTRPRDLLSGRFNVADVEFLEKWIGFSAEKPADAADSDRSAARPPVAGQARGRLRAPRTDSGSRKRTPPTSASGWRRSRSPSSSASCASPRKSATATRPRPGSSGASCASPRRSATATRPRSPSSGASCASPAKSGWPRRKRSAPRSGNTPTPSPASRPGTAPRRRGAGTAPAATR